MRERWGAVSHSHLRGTHLAFTQWPGGIWRPGFLLPRPCVCLLTAFVLALFQTDPFCFSSFLTSSGIFGHLTWPGIFLALIFFKFLIQP